MNNKIRYPSKEKSILFSPTKISEIDPCPDTHLSLIHHRFTRQFRPTRPCRPTTASGCSTLGHPIIHSWRGFRLYSCTRNPGPYLVTTPSPRRHRLMESCRSLLRSDRATVTRLISLWPAAETPIRVYPIKGILEPCLCSLCMKSENLRDTIVEMIVEASDPRSLQVSLGRCKWQGLCLLWQRWSIIEETSFAVLQG